MSDQTTSPGRAVLVADGLTKHYAVRERQARGRGRVRQQVRAVDGISISLYERRVTAVVGESGSGKTTLSRLLARLERPSSGRIVLDGAAAGHGTRDYRRRVQLVFQDPFSSLNPIHSVGYHLERPLLNYRRATRASVGRATRELLEQVNLVPAARFVEKLPHELSGGQRQRVAIARALAARPEVLVADEPVSMLDVSIRIGVLNLLGRLRDENGLAILYITHDIASARYFADEICVVYAGRIVESGPSLAVADAPVHPYTQLLLSAAPDPARMGRAALGESIGSAKSGAGRAARGCPFRGRCPHAMESCAEDPPEVSIGEGHQVSCWLHAGAQPVAAAANGAIQ